MLNINKLEKLGLNYAAGTMRPNLLSIPVNNLTPTIENAEIFNEIYNEVLKEKIRRFERTASGGISLKKLFLPAWNIEMLTTKSGRFSGVELVLLFGTFATRINFSSRPHTAVNGNMAFKKFRQVCRQFHINLKDYEVSSEEGSKIKEHIEKPFIKVSLDSFIDMTFENVHHIDFHSSYPAGLKNVHPEFLDVINYLYERRHEHPEYKDVLNCSIGFMQSKYCGFKFSKLARDAIADNNARILKLANKINLTKDRVVLLYNTDGFWYKGPIYHGEGEGDNIGEWHNDHINCTLRIKSAGAYEYLEDGEYHPVLRGLTSYDKVKERSKWGWGDIYRDECEPITFGWREGEGVIYE